MSNMNWHPHTELPPAEGPIRSYLVAVSGNEGTIFLSGIYDYRGNTDTWVRFEDGSTGQPAEQFWWLSEDQLLEGIKP
jgi:hypothetical protein